mgnify:CR=1 FL=1
MLKLDLKTSIHGLEQPKNPNPPKHTKNMVIIHPRHNIFMFQKLTKRSTKINSNNKKSTKYPYNETIRH